MTASEKTTKPRASAPRPEAPKNTFFRKPGEGFFNTKENTLFRKKDERFFTPGTSSFPVQKKMSVNQPGDAHEQEADAVADKVMRMPASQPATEKEEKLQAKEQQQVKAGSEGGTAVTPSFEQGLQSSKGGGNPLPDGVKQQMETGIGADFSNVRVHTGAHAAQLSNSIQAQAFTHGSDIYFNEGKYSPGTDSGKHLLAHELTHTVQQNPQRMVKRKPFDVQAPSNVAVADNTRVYMPHPVQQPLAQSKYPPPGHVAYGMNYYLDRASDFEKRTGKPAPTYYRSYGNKYIQRFKTITTKQLSAKGKVWLEKALINLQTAMETKLHTPAGAALELNDSKFTDFAFDTHVKAYEDAGVLKLSIMDKIKILLTPDASDLLSDRGLKQGQAIATDQMAYYFWHPVTAGEQAVEFAQHIGEITKLVSQYYLRNKKFFDELSKTNPQHWSDPEHRIIVILKSMLFPSYIF